MAFVIIKTGFLSAEAKKRLGDRVLYALQQEGIKASDSALCFECMSCVVYVGGGLVGLVGENVDYGGVSHNMNDGYDARPTGLTPVTECATHASKAPRAAPDRDALRVKLADLCRRDKSLSSFEAQKRLGLDNCDWAPNTLRRLFADLIEEGAIRKEGEKRGTRYHWVVDEPLPAAKLEKV